MIWKIIALVIIVLLLVADYAMLIVAIGYAERQMADTLKRAGKVKVEL